MGVPCWCFFLIYACHLLVSIYCTNYIMWVSSWLGCLSFVIRDLCASFASKWLMHRLFRITWNLLPRIVYSLVCIVMLYDGLTMNDIIGANHINKVHFLHVSLQYKQVCAKMGWFASTRLIYFSLSCWHVLPVINLK